MSAQSNSTELFGDDGSGDEMLGATEIRVPVRLPYKQAHSTGGKRQNRTVTANALSIYKVAFRPTDNTSKQFVKQIIV